MQKTSEALTDPARLLPSWRGGPASPDEVRCPRCKANGRHTGMPLWRGTSVDCQRTDAREVCPERWRHFQVRVRLHTAPAARAPTASWDREHPEGRPLVAVEYWDGHPTDVVSDGSGYNFEMTERNGLYYQDVGSGGTNGTFEVSAYFVPTGERDDKGQPVFLPPDPAEEPRAWLWLAPGVVPVQMLEWDAAAFRYRRSRVLSREDLRAMGYLLLDELPGNPFDDACEGEVVYCGVCREHLPVEDGTYSGWTCDHVYWCDKHGGLGGEGLDESDRVCTGGPHDDEDDCDGEDEE